jgi:hypothetical protein
MSSVGTFRAAISADISSFAIDCVCLQPSPQVSQPDVVVWYQHAPGMQGRLCLGERGEFCEPSTNATLNWHCSTQVESSIYYTAMLIPGLPQGHVERGSLPLLVAPIPPTFAASFCAAVVFGAHPLVMLFTKYDLTIAALIGHDGFGYPSTVSG